MLDKQINPIRFQPGDVVFTTHIFTNGIDIAEFSAPPGNADHGGVLPSSRGCVDPPLVARPLGDEAPVRDSTPADSLLYVSLTICATGAAVLGYCLTHFHH